jgi:hypothetical protein
MKKVYNEKGGGVQNQKGEGSEIRNVWTGPVSITDTAKSELAMSLTPLSQNLAVSLLLLNQNLAESLTPLSRNLAASLIPSSQT